MCVMNIQTHFTRHPDGRFSLIDQGMPLTAPVTKLQCYTAARRYFPNAELPIWNAERGEFEAEQIKLK